MFSLGLVDLYSTQPSGRLVVTTAKRLDQNGNGSVRKTFTALEHDQLDTRQSKNRCHPPSFHHCQSQSTTVWSDKVFFFLLQQTRYGWSFRQVNGLLPRILRCKSRDLSVGRQNPVGFRLLSAAPSCFADVQRFARRHERNCIQGALEALRLH